MLTGVTVLLVGLYIPAAAPVFFWLGLLIVAVGLCCPADPDKDPPVIDPDLPQKTCPACGKKYDFDYPKCPHCGYEDAKNNGTSA